jgi:hypothetical protein
MKTMRILVGLIILFLSGTLLGIALTRIYIIKKVERELGQGPDMVRVYIMNMLDRELDLTDEQWPVIEETVREGQGQIFILRQDFQPKLERTIEQTIQQMAPHLNRQQQQELDGIWERIRSQWQGGPTLKSGEPPLTLGK